MHSFISLSLLFVLVSLGLAQATFQEGCTAEICGEPSYTSELPDVQRRTGATTTKAGRRHFTNAQRLSRGLPLLPPNRRADSCLSDPPPSSPQASAVPQVTYEGILELRKVSDSTVSLGYVSTASRPIGGQFTITSDTTIALRVSFALNPGETTGTAISLTMVNSDGPLFGLIRGRDSTSSDIDNTFNYLYYNGIALPGTGPGCPPTAVTTSYSSDPKRDAESSIWNIELTTGLLTPHWINSDLSTPTVVSWLQSNYMYAGGNSGAFVNRYPSPITEITFLFVPVV